MTEQCLKERIDSPHARGLLYIVLAALLLSIMGLCVILLGNQLPVSEEVFVRFFISFLTILPIIIKTRSQFSFHIQEPWRMAGRAIAGFLAIVFYFMALHRIPLTETILLSNITPLFVPIFVYLLFRIKTTWPVWMGSLICCLGVVIVLHPEGSVTFSFGALFALGTSAFSALSLLLLRQLTKTHKESPLLLYYFVFCTVISGIWTLFDFQMPNAHQWLLLLGIGFFGAFYQFFLTWSLARIPARIATPTMLSSALFGALWSWLTFDILPSLFTVIGGLVLLGGVITVVRFQR